MGSRWAFLSVFSFFLVFNSAFADHDGRGRGKVQVLDNQVAAIMSYANRGGDGLPPTQLYAGIRLRGGERLTLDEVSGKSHYRVRNSHVSEGSSPCPDNWLLHFVDDRGTALFSRDEALASYMGRGGEVPRGTAAIYIGYKDSAYFDNEGKRSVRRVDGPGGCRFVFRLEREPLVELKRGMVAAIMSPVRESEGGDGLQSVEIFRGVLSPGTLVLAEASGTNNFRVRNSGAVEGSSQCPDNWKINFKDRFGRLIRGGFRNPEDLSAYSGRGAEVPEDAASAWIGYEDSAYFDNEGKRRPKTTTNGCTFKLVLWAE